MTLKRVVVTGLGAITPLGLSAETTWDALIKGKSGAGEISLFDAKGFSTRIAAEVKNFDLFSLKSRYPFLSEAMRSSLLAIHAAEEAMKDANFKTYRSSRFGIYLGAGDSGNDFYNVSCLLNDASHQSQINPMLYYQRATGYLNGRRELELQPCLTVAHLAHIFNVQGPVSSSLTACAASSQAIGEAYEWIRSGYADCVMTGGSHAMIYPMSVAGFSLLTVLSRKNDDPQKASRPFDKNRDGFVLGEGAGILILEELSHALDRNAKIYGEIVGYGATADAYRLTDMDPDGRGAQRALEIALRKADISPEDIDYINAHGTSTALNDFTETVVIKKIFKERAYEIPVSSIKSMLGHMIAAAGAIEAIACLLSLRDQIVPPTINYETQDPDCDLDYVPNEAKNRKMRYILSNSFGFGGQNIGLIFKQYE